MAALRSCANFIFEILELEIISFATLAATAKCNVWRAVQLTYSSI